MTYRFHALTHPSIERVRDEMQVGVNSGDG